MPSVNSFPVSAKFQRGMLLRAEVGPGAGFDTDSDLVLVT